MVSDMQRTFTIFLSYSNLDKIYATAFGEFLRGAGFSVWQDVSALKPGSNFRKRIVEAIEDVDLVVVLWSPHSVESNYVTDEANLAKRHEKYFAILIQECDLPLGFGSDHTFPLSEGQLNTESSERSVVLDWINQILAESASEDHAEIENGEANLLTDKLDSLDTKYSLSIQIDLSDFYTEDAEVTITDNGTVSGVYNDRGVRGKVEGDRIVFIDDFDPLDRGGCSFVVLEGVSLNHCRSSGAVRVFSKYDDLNYPISSGAYILSRIEP